MFGYYMKLPIYMQYILFMCASLVLSYVVMFSRYIGLWETTTDYNVTDATGNRSCSPIYAKNLAGAEDLVLLDNLLFISSAHRRRVYSDEAHATALLQSRGYNASVSDLFSRFAILDREEDRGSVYFADLSHGVDQLAPVALPISGWDWNAEPDFHPLGLDVINVSKDNRTYTQLRAVVVTRDGSKIAQFAVIRDESDTPTELQLEYVAAHPLLTNVNNLVSIDEKTFYISNFFAASSSQPSQMAYEVLMMKSHGSVVKCSINQLPPAPVVNGERKYITMHYSGLYDDAETSTITLQDANQKKMSLSCFTAIDTLGQPNGLELLPEHDVLLVASSHHRLIQGYSLRNHKKLFATEAGAGLDNMARDEDGAVWVASHPRSVDFVKTIADDSYKAPNRVQRLSIRKSTVFPTIKMLDNPETIYEEKAPKDFGAMSTAVPIPSKFAKKIENNVEYRYFVGGSVFDDGLLVCKYQYK
jgi:hypothetical protein